jgi:hypothetical protein
MIASESNIDVAVKEPTETLQEAFPAVGVR